MTRIDFSKICSKCNQVKFVFEFVKNKRGPHGAGGECKKCFNIRCEDYAKTKNGVCNSIHRDQRKSSRQRKHSMPPYSLDDLRHWCLSQPLFHHLYNKWVESGYNRWHKPSCDRTDDTQGYSLDRLTIMTWRENNAKGFSDKMKGIDRRMLKPVVQMNLDGTFVAEYYSISEAGRQIGRRNRDISACCNGDQKTAFGYRWMHSLGISIHNNEVK